jgi:hypothetical protein
MARYLSALVLGFGITAALAGDDDPVKQPYVEVGDCWTYRTAYTSKPDRPGGHKLCVTYVDREKNLILVVARTNGGREVDLTYTGEWTAIAGFRNVSTLASHELKFPLRVGDAYSFVHEYHRKSDEQVWGRTHYDMKVVGWEDVTVPAGTFRALRIEGIGVGRGMRGTQARPFEHRTTIWYAPEVNRKVKSIIFRSSKNITVEELVEYSLKK